MPIIFYIFSHNMEIMTLDPPSRISNIRINAILRIRLFEFRLNKFFFYISYPHQIFSTPRELFIISLIPEI